MSNETGNDMGLQLLLEVRQIVGDNDRLLREVLAMMHQQAKNLEYLPRIADTLSDIKENLIDPATGKKQIPLVSHLITVAVLGAIILVVFLKDSDRSVSVGPGGISIGKQAADVSQNNH